MSWRAKSSRTGQSSTAATEANERTINAAFDVRRADLLRRREVVQRDLANADQQIENWKATRQLHSNELEEVEREILALDAEGHRRPGPSIATPNAINYMEQEFEWSGQLKLKLKRIFGIDDFRLCQKGVCNANLHQRHIICVMPTGGGKSLTYQLPALLSRGCTLVVSPLISLMSDQVLHLKENNVEAVMLNGNTPKREVEQTYERLMNPPANGGEGIKLLYVTPERIKRSTRFMGFLLDLARNGLLVRIVIDEAHCISSMGHDYRPDYLELRRLTDNLRHIPILALSATCPPRVQNDIIKILGLPQATAGTMAAPGRTVFFSSPLYRKNLHYKVMPKPPKESDHLDMMVDYILENHPNESGIVYCTTKLQTHKVAEGLEERSRRKIKTGIYHADIEAEKKQTLHEKWRQGSVKVVCATIAFGLGIDKGDVRFVLHHSASKTVEGYYQESGRAGRDGKDSDCILYYRPQDASSILTMTPGTGDVREILRYAQDKSQCRQVFFANYFSASANLDPSAWSADGAGATQRCGHCDNCLRDSTSYTCGDKTLEAWQILKIAEEVYKLKGNVTIGTLAALAGGSRQAKIMVKPRRGVATEVQIDVGKIAGGKAELTVAETEILIIQLIVDGYLTAQVQQTKWTSYAYIIPSFTASQITRLARDGLGKCGVSVRCYLPSKARKTGKGKKRATSGGEDPPLPDTATTSRSRPSQLTGKRKKMDDPEEDGSVIEISSDVAYEEDEISEADPSPRSRSRGGLKPLNSGTRGAGSRPQVMDVDSEPEEWMAADSEDVGGWTFSHRPKPRNRRRTKSPSTTMADLSDF